MRLCACCSLSVLSQWPHRYLNQQPRVGLYVWCTVYFSCGVVLASTRVRIHESVFVVQHWFSFCSFSLDVYFLAQTYDCSARRTDPSYGSFLRRRCGCVGSNFCLPAALERLYSCAAT